MPFIASVMGGSKAVGREMFTLQLNFTKMGHPERWSAGAREYSNSCGGSIDLELYLGAYYQSVCDFYRWLAPKVEEWSREEWAKTAALQDRLVRYENRI
jgi:hypothetical protein